MRGSRSCPNLHNLSRPLSPVGKCPKTAKSLVKSPTFPFLSTLTSDRSAHVSTLLCDYGTLSGDDASLRLGLALALALGVARTLDRDKTTNPNVFAMQCVYAACALCSSRGELTFVIHVITLIITLVHTMDPEAILSAFSEANGSFALEVAQMAWSAVAAARNHNVHNNDD